MCKLPVGSCRYRSAVFQHLSDIAAEGVDSDATFSGHRVGDFNEFFMAFTVHFGDNATD
jgi:hypothetical protein